MADAETRKRKHEGEETTRAKRSKKKHKRERRRGDDAEEAKDPVAVWAEDVAEKKAGKKSKKKSKDGLRLKRQERQGQDRPAAEGAEPALPPVDSTGSAGDGGIRNAKTEKRRKSKITETSAKRRKRTKKANGISGHPRPADGELDSPKVTKKHRKRVSREQTEHGETEQQERRLATSQKAPKTFKLSDCTAGRYIDHDPLLVQDGSGKEYMLAATAEELQVLSVETSLLERTLRARDGASIVGFAVHEPRTPLVCVAYSNGAIDRWQWTTDQPATSVSDPNPVGDIKSVAAVSAREPDDKTTYTMPRVIRVDGSTAIRVQAHTVYTTKRVLESIQVFGNGDYLVAHGDGTVCIGAKGDDYTSYTVTEFSLNKRATCVHARLVGSPTGTKKSDKRQSRLQLAVGTSNGQILLYDDVTSMFSTNQQTLQPPRILHWHRSAVAAVKFSPDGNYLISGGKETVLVLWQLETGHKQYVPHLTSAIERVTVNEKGDRYALQMGDNSIMVLSTAELKPVANFAGLQMQTAIPGPLAASLHPKDPQKLLITVPPTRPDGKNEAAPRAFLQTFDLRTCRHTTRQALTRNNVTDFNEDGDGHPILSPDVHHLAISADGEWLATVDEWMPPIRDLGHVATSPQDLEEAQRWRREVYLKIWHWDAEHEDWTLSTRVDAPHERVSARGKNAPGAGRVVALVADPAGKGFATVGEGRCVKIWRPKKRARSGRATEPDFIEWSCRQSVQLSTDKSQSDPTAHAASAAPITAAWSGDGSLLAVSCPTPTTLDDESLPSVTFIDVATSTVKAVRTGLSSNGTAPIVAIGFLDRYFITLTHLAVVVWDVVTEELVQKVKVPLAADDDNGTSAASPPPQLAIDTVDQSFALVTAPQAHAEGVSRVAIYSVHGSEGKMYEMHFDVPVVKILPGTAEGSGGRGYTLLFADITVRTLVPGVGGSAARIAALADSSAVGGDGGADAGEVMDVDEDEEVDDEAPALLLGNGSGVKVGGSGRGEEDDRPVVTPEQLAAVLEAGPGVGVREMLRGVVGLFSRKGAQAVKA